VLIRPPEEVPAVPVGLSADELQFIADFIGACILENGDRALSWSDVTVRLAQYQRARLEASETYPADQDHKMILLLEFLCRSGCVRSPLPCGPALRGCAPVSPAPPDKSYCTIPAPAAACGSS